MPTDVRVPSATVLDWKRDWKLPFRRAPFRRSLSSLRNYQYWRARDTWGVLPSKWAVLRHRFRSITKECGLPVNTETCAGLLIPHRNGNVVDPQCKFGLSDRAVQYVTLGSNGTSAGKAGVPALGGQFDVGAGPKILASIIIDENAIILANAVVLTDVPANATAIGIPARVILRTDQATT